MHQLTLLAGSAAAAIFMISQLPMLIKACRTRNLSSYSFANIGLANVGNLLYAVYVSQVPVGPVWAIHGFNVTTSGMMLYLYLRHAGRAGVVDGHTEPDTGQLLRSTRSATRRSITRLWT